MTELGEKFSGRSVLPGKDSMEHALEMKGNIQFQDSFFRRLFKEPKYRKALYTVLHPEDMDAADSEFENIELDNVLNVDIYNDICFTVRNRLVMLIEHQSTLNYNMPVRVFYIWLKNISGCF